MIVYLPIVSGCDSLAYIRFNYQTSDTTTTQQTSCDSYTWLGKHYTSGVYDSLFTNSIGCDSLVILDLTINFSDTTNFQVITCDSYTWDGVSYTSTGIYNNLYSNIEGCDSLVVLDLTINTPILLPRKKLHVILTHGSVQLIQQVVSMIVCLPIIVAVIV